MKYSTQLQKMTKLPLMLAVVLAPAVGCSDTEAEGMTQNESHSDSSMAAKNWDNVNGPDTQPVAPSNDVDMVAETWRSLDQPVTYGDSLAAKNWNNVNGPGTQPVAPSTDVDMAAKNWKETQ